MGGVGRRVHRALSRRSSRPWRTTQALTRNLPRHDRANVLVALVRHSRRERLSDGDDHDVSGRGLCLLHIFRGDAQCDAGRVRRPAIPTDDFWSGTRTGQSGGDALVCCIGRLIRVAGFDRLAIRRTAIRDQPGGI